LENPALLVFLEVVAKLDTEEDVTARELFVLDTISFSILLIAYQKMTKLLLEFISETFNTLFRILPLQWQRLWNSLHSLFAQLLVEYSRKKKQTNFPILLEERQNSWMLKNQNNNTKQFGMCEEMNS
jgi:hypothetical protein